MSIGYRKENVIVTPGPDNTVVRQHVIELSKRDTDALENLRSRNGAGIGCIPVENIAIWKVINQICEREKTK